MAEELLEGRIGKGRLGKHRNLWINQKEMNQDLGMHMYTV